MEKSYGLWFSLLVFFTKLFAFAPFKNKNKVYTVFTVTWFIVLTILIYLTVDNYKRISKQESIINFISSLLFVAQILTNMVILIEAFNKHQTFSAIENAFKKIFSTSGLPKREPTKTVAMWKRINLKLAALFSFLGFMYGVTIFTYVTTDVVKGLFWCNLLQKQALNVRALQIIVCLIIVNEHLDVMAEKMQEAANLNGNKVKSNLWISCSDEERKMMVVFSTVYDKLYDLFNLLNNCFGWSTLAMVCVFFTDFLLSSYCLIVLTKNPGTPTQHFQCVATVLIVGVLTTLMCWYGQECFNKGKYIGCSVFKLSKPHGNKQYNDLVIEFSLQTLHQTFAVGAKEFFNLNLEFLGGMVKAVVTYLVILIQFMFTDHKN